MAVINGTMNNDTLKGGAGNDIVTGLAGNDRALMGGGNDVFVWNVGDGKDTIEGGDGVDTLRFTADDKADTMEISANGTRTRFSRSADSTVLDLNDVERIDLRARGGSDVITIKNLAGTDVKQVAIDLAGTTPGVGDGASDGINLYGKTGNDTINVALVNNRVTVTGLAAQVTVANTEVNDKISIDAAPAAMSSTRRPWRLATWIWSCAAEPATTGSPAARGTMICSATAAMTPSPVARAAI